MVVCEMLCRFDKAVSFCNANLQYKQVAETLNVLDYDTYFQMTELLLAGDYTSALIRYDEVLSKGFSGQTFMAGLNQHMRDLLLAKGPAISLIELTGSLLDRYRQQAEQCAPEFLFGAISLLTEADGKIKQSSNQRLLVELGLMKIAGLGKKKNNDDGITIAEEYHLPELPQNITPAATTVAQSVRPTATPVVTATDSAASGSKIEEPATATSATPAAQPATMPTASATQQNSVRETQPAKPTAPRRSALDCGRYLAGAPTICCCVRIDANRRSHNQAGGPIADALRGDYALENRNTDADGPCSWCGGYAGDGYHHQRRDKGLTPN